MAFNYSINDGAYTGTCNNLGEWNNLINDGRQLRQYMVECTLKGTAPDDITQMFQGCWELKSIDLTEFDTSNTRQMNSVFSNCHSLEAIDLTSCDTRNVNSMLYMFDGCSNLKTIKVNKATWNKNSEAVDTYYMFWGCESLPNYDGTSDGTKAIDKSLGGYLDVVTAPTKYYKYYEHYSDGVKVIPKSTDMFEFITQEMYDQITPDPDMLYFIIEEE